MQKRRLGKTDVEVMPVGLGCWQFGNAGTSLDFWGQRSQETVDEIVAVSLRHGVNLFDTAEAYGNGSSEKALSWALVSCAVSPEEVVIATKWNPRWRTARSLVDTLQRRRESLSCFPIGLYQIHSESSLSSIRKQMSAMAQLLQSGQIRAAGVSNFSADMMRRAHAFLQEKGYPLASNQVVYNLLNRTIEHNGVLQAARELGITIIAYSPLAQGLLTGKFHRGEANIQDSPGPRKSFPMFQEDGLKKSAPLIAVLEEIARAYGVTPGQVALNWLVHAHQDTVVVIPGASASRHAVDNAEAVQFQLTPREMQKIDEVSTTVSI